MSPFIKPIIIINNSLFCLIINFYTIKNTKLNKPYSLLKKQLNRLLIYNYCYFFKNN